jgi:uncharacterized protein (DUF2141 family)
MRVLARLVLAAGLLTVLSLPLLAEDPSATLTIRIENVSARGGIVRLGLYERATYPDNDSTPVASADVTAQPGETIITLKHLAPGIYAIETFQDINANGKMDTSWIGLPLEPFGFSRDVRPFLGKPTFDAVKFTLAPGENTQTVHLRYFSS